MTASSGPKWISGYVYEVNGNNLRIVKKGTSTFAAWLEADPLWVKRDDPRIQPPGWTSRSDGASNDDETSRAKSKNAMHSALITWRKSLQPHSKVDCLIAGQWRTACVYDTKPGKVQIVTDMTTAFWDTLLNSEKRQLWINCNDPRVQPHGSKTSNINGSDDEASKPINGDCTVNDINTLRSKLERCISQTKSMKKIGQKQNNEVNVRIDELESELDTVQRDVKAQKEAIKRIQVKMALNAPYQGVSVSAPPTPPKPPRSSNRVKKRKRPASTLPVTKRKRVKRS